MTKRFSRKDQLNNSKKFNCSFLRKGFTGGAVVKAALGDKNDSRFKFQTKITGNFCTVFEIIGATSIRVTLVDQSNLSILI